MGGISLNQYVFFTFAPPDKTGLPCSPIPFLDLPEQLCPSRYSKEFAGTFGRSQSLIQNLSSLPSAVPFD
ncbi:hypothetical protein KCP74_18185 [Salmonella enterica subsp. enterica]|nr:hypothetical protein KCP74_18185 [Salmonella enterica subsp. enterica]